MKPVTEWDEEYIFSLPYGEFDWLEVKGRKTIDLKLISVKESDVLENLAKEISAFANSGGGQLILGLANPSSTTGKWSIDDGGVSTSVKGKIDTREWLEDIVPNLVEYPLMEFNVYAITPKNAESQISSGRALHVIDVANSLSAPHQSRHDNKYYARVAGKSRPISHRMAVDIIGRRQYPKIEFEIEKRFIKGEPRTMFSSTVYLDGTRPSEKDTNTYTLKIRAWNTGKVYAQCVNSFILIPVQLLPTNEIKWNMDRLEKIDGKAYFRYYKDNTERDSVGGSGLQREYGPARYDPILPELSHGWEITLQHDSENLGRKDLFVKWTAYADNAPSNSGEIKISDIDVADAVEPNFDALSEDDDI